MLVVDHLLLVIFPSHISYSSFIIRPFTQVSYPLVFHVFAPHFSRIHHLHHLFFNHFLLITYFPPHLSFSTFISLSSPRLLVHSPLPIIFIFPLVYLLPFTFPSTPSHHHVLLLLLLHHSFITSLCDAFFIHHLPISHVPSSSFLRHSSSFFYFIVASYSFTWCLLSYSIISFFSTTRSIIYSLQSGIRIISVFTTHLFSCNSLLVFSSPYYSPPFPLFLPVIPPLLPLLPLLSLDLPRLTKLKPLSHVSAISLSSFFPLCFKEI